MKPGWNLQLVRQDGTRSYTMPAVRWRLALYVFMVLLIPAVAGFLSGRQFTRLSDATRLTELEAEVDRLNLENGRVVELASRLESVEAAYLRLQRAMGGEVTPSGRDVLLPPPSGARTAGALATRGEDDRDTPAAWPLAERGFVTRAFGTRTGNDEMVHEGLDIAVPLASYVRASGGGVVSEARDDPVYGLYVRIAHVDGVTSLYGHNSWLFAAVGDRVEALQVIALSGNTGRSTAPHLHFEVREDGVAVDPLAHVPLGR